MAYAALNYGLRNSDLGRNMTAQRPRSVFSSGPVFFPLKLLVHNDRDMLFGIRKWTAS